MYVINDIKDIECFKVKEKKSEQKGFKNMKVYVFKEDGHYADVVFKCFVPFLSKSFKPAAKMKYLNHVLGKNKKTRKEQDAVFFYARNVVFEEGGGVLDLTANNFSAKKDCTIRYLYISNSLKCENLKAVMVAAKDIDAENLEADTISAFKTLRAKKLVIGDTELFDVKSTGGLMQ